MRNWKYFRLIIGTGFFFILCPFLVTEKIYIHSKAIAEQTTKYSDRLTQENLEIKVQQLDEKATQQFQNGELESALETWQQVLEIRNQQGDRFHISSTLYSIATIYKQQYKYQQALEYYQQALEIRQQLGDQDLIAATLHNIGTVYYHLSQYPQALESLNQALVIRQQLGDRTAISRTLNEIAIIYDTQGRYSQSLEFYQEALKIAKQEKYRANISAILSNMGLVYSQLGQYEQAINFYQEVLNTNPPTKAKILNNIGAIYRHLKEFPKALEFYQQALAIHRENQDRFGIATTLDNIGTIYREQGKNSQALESHQEALIIREELGDKEGQAATLHHIGIVHRESDRHPDALQFLTHTLIIDRQLGNQDGERITLANIGKLLERKNHPQLAIIFYKQSVNVTETIRKNLKVLPAEQQKSYIESVAEIYRTLADLLLQEKRAIEAHQILDLLKEQEIFEYMGNLNADEDEYTESPLLELEKIFWKKYTQLMNEVGTNQVDEQNISSEKLLSIHNFIDSEEVAKIVSELDENAHGQKLTSDLLLSLKYELQEHQEKNTVVLYPLLLEDRLELILVSANSDPIHRTVSVTKEEFNQAILKLRVRLTNRNKAQSLSRGNNNQPDRRVMEAGAKLYNWLIKPIEPHLTIMNAKTIVYAPDGPLRYVPLAALYDGEKWLVEKFKINNITTASFMDLTPKTEINPLVLAGALTEGIYNFQVGKKNFDFEGLPFAGVEVEKLATMFSQTNKLLGNSFTKKAMVSQMDNYNIVHFATHAAFVNGHPEESFILFGDGSRASLRDVKDWDLRNVELVVLSACQTGVGKQLGNGVEILGFAYQIQEAGASATLATLWRVDDQGTHEFMNDFYAALKNGATKSEAVQKAQISMINSEFNHPYYWAPFILIGNGF
ncbi:tetratricopeptide repeat protein [Okeania sp. SIO1I7]|uniref:CHAT domain-containing protein n=1 Tax=Okeania sp. SIO1I7 TaxID=2607772 RepID=UPI0013FBDD65|nr:tetratricopeptide repeat protein [Okeania sp. SIO1I7]NET26163.1 tetratricopeptide repeat protein [Okeania sp. SIO1I7]